MNVMWRDQQPAHAKISPSSAHRTIPCPGSIKLIATLPPQPGSTAANEGTAAHTILSRCIEMNTEPRDYIGEVLQVEDEQFTVDDAMCDGIDLMLDLVDKFLDDGYQVKTEQKVALDHLCPGQFGTADIVLTNAKKKAVAVLDFKYGRVVRVAIEENPQLLTYLSGVVHRLPFQALDLTIGIVQPRAGGETVKVASVTPEQLRRHEAAFAKAAKLALTDDAPRAAGEWCEWCPAAGICPEIRELARQRALQEFGIEPETPVQVRAAELTPDQVGQLLNEVDLIESWIGAVRSAALQAAVSTGVVPTGWKLVANRTHRKWIDEAKVEGLFRMIYELDDDQMFTKKLISPAQAEKLLGKKSKDKLTGLWHHPAGTPTLAPMSDRREALKIDPRAELKQALEAVAKE
jgi:hypothetical protein